MDRISPDPRERGADQPAARVVGPRVALLSILGFWLFYFAVNTLRMHGEPLAEQLPAAEKRLVVGIFGMVLSYGLYLVLRPFDGRRLGVRITAAFALSLPASFAYATINYIAFFKWHPTDQTLAEIAKYPDHAMSPAAMIADAALNWYFFIVAWSVFYVALSYAAEVRAAERRAAGFRAAAQAAELRALRYQVNPHFLFNTLNSLSSLVLTEKRDEAERMILNLSTFFRTSLTADPTEDVPLAEEIRLQRLYLDIEAVRFPERLKVDIAVPEALRSACVPGLILQPLVENAIKYGVSRARRPVTVRIAAREDSRGLVLSVEDDGDPIGWMPMAADGSLLDTAAGEGPPRQPPLGGTGLGLKNVRDRLAARFGEAGQCRWGPVASGGFCVMLFLPLSRNAC